MTRPLMIGQAPGRVGDASSPCAGPPFQRMAKRSGAEDPSAWLDKFERVNLLDAYPEWPDQAARKGDHFPRRLAEQAARRMRPRLQDRVVVIMGRNVAWAFDLEALPYLEWMSGPPWDRIAVVPHPSGVNLWWNSEENQRTARAFFEALLNARG